MLSVLTVLALASAPLPEPGPAPAPTVDTVRSRPRFRGLGLSIAGGLLGVGWLAVKGTVSANDPSVARDLDRGKQKGCIESCYIGTTFNPVGSVLLVGSAALLGGGMHVHGRWLAHQDRGLGRSARTGRILAGVGGGMLGAGVLGLSLGLGLQRLQGSSETQMLRSRELGWWSATAFGITGAALAGLGHGIVRGHRERRERIQVSVAPMFGAGITGLSFSGRF
jgi:hypothetical protein